jgi:predicted GIY-YIG superfamily endonuclease
MAKKEAIIYAMVSLKNSSAYVGQTTAHKTRFMYHAMAVKNGKHEHRRVRVTFRAHGIQDIEFRILERCHWDGTLKWKRHANAREQHWIKTYPNTINTARKDGMKFSDLKVVSVAGRNQPTH